MVPQFAHLIYCETDEEGNPNGRELVLEQIDFEPLGYTQLLEAKNPGRTTLPIRIRSGVVVKSYDPNLAPGTRIIASSGSLPTPLTVNTVGLVPGGWLPPGFAAFTGAIVGFDRCTIPTVKAIFNGNGASQSSEDSDFLSLLSSAGTRINPLFSIIEGSNRRSPSESELRIQFRQVCDVLRNALPASILIPVDEGGLKGAIGLVLETFAQMERDREFLLAIVPLLKNPVAKAKRLDTWAKVMKIARKTKMTRPTLALMAALSCVMAPQDRNHARAILKPGKSPYHPEDAYNALADLRQLELLINLSATFPNERVMFCTDDVHLAAFWAGLAPRNFVRGKKGTTFALTCDHLFPNSDAEQWRELIEWEASGCAET
jgi:hypothetical protein